MATGGETAARLTRLGRLTGIGSSATGQIVAALATLAGVRVYTEILAPEAFGLAMAAMGVVAFLDGLVTMALNQTLLSLCAQSPEREAQRRAAVTLSFRLALILGACMLPLAAMTPLAASLLGRPTLFALAPALAWLYLIEEILKTAILSPMAARREYARYALWTAAEALATLLVTAATLMAWRADALGFVVGLVLSRWLNTLAFAALYAGRAYFAGAAAAPADRLIEKALGYGGPVCAMAPLGWIGAYMDRYALTAVRGLSSAGVYTAVGGLVGRPFAVTTAVLTNYFRPLLFSRDDGEATTTALWRHARAWIAAAALIGLAYTGALSVLSGLVARMALAPDYRAGAPAIMVALSLAQTFVIMTHAVDNAVLSTGESARLLRLQVFLVICSVVLVPLGAYWDRGFGAALGRLAAEAIKFAATATLFGRMLQPAERLQAAVAAR